MVQTGQPNICLNLVKKEGQWVNILSNADG